MRSKIKTAGAIVLGLGIVLLATGLILSVTVGTRAVPILVSSSMVVNTVGIMLLRHRSSQG